MAVRVLRLMEYTYPDFESADEDMQRWHVQHSYSPRSGFIIRSTVILSPVPAEEPLLAHLEAATALRADREAEAGK